MYLGAPNAADFAPGERCFVDAADFAGPRALAEYLRALAADPTRSADYHAWRDRPFRPTFLRLLASQAAHPVVRLFERVRQRLTSTGPRGGDDA